jgi:hypothetical protein
MGREMLFPLNCLNISKTNLNRTGRPPRYIGQERKEMSKNDNRQTPDSEGVFGQVVEAGKQLANAVWGVLDAGKEASDAQNDAAERLAVYQRIGEFITRQFKVPVRLGYATAVHMTGQGDEAVARVPVPPSEAVRTVKRSLIMIRLEYQAEGHEYTRALSFWYLQGDKPARQIVSEGISWDALPKEVREQWQRDRESPVVFRLYSEEK